MPVYTVLSSVSALLSRQVLTSFDLKLIEKMQKYEGKLCLQWNDFQKNITSAFGELKSDKDFTDVTLVSEDGQKIEAHKLVLISSSPFFLNLFKGNKHQHPLLYMRGVKYEDLQAMMDFLYHGEANVNQERLDSFLVLAEELKLKGLKGAQTAENLERTPEKANRIKGLQTKQELLFRDIPEDTLSMDTLDPFQDIQDTTVGLTDQEMITDVGTLDQQVKSMMTSSENFLTDKNQQRRAKICNICGKEGKQTSIVNHIEAKHLNGVSLPCNDCGLSFTTRNTLAQHKSRAHKDI